VRRDGDPILIGWHATRRFHLGFVEQPDLIRRDLLAAGRLTAGQREVQLFLQENDFGLQLLIASGLISDQ
jgi:hypothetical protein